MPNVGRPSRDCQTCRQRRLKCDLVRPECNQCLRKGLLCPGYRDELDMRFRVNSVSSVQATLKRKPRKIRNVDDKHFVSDRTECEQPCCSSMALILTKDCSPLATPAESWDIHSLPYAISKLSNVYWMCPRIFETALRLFGRMNETSHLNLACKAVATAFLANSTRSPEVSIEQTKAYSKSIVAVNSAIRDPQKVKSDDTFLSISLLAFYEVIQGARSENRSYLFDSPGYKAHTKALADLVRLRGADMCMTPDARNLIGITHCHLQTRSLMSGFSSESLCFMFHYLYQAGAPEYNILRSYIYSYHCTEICRRIRNLLEIDDPDVLLANSSSIVHAIDHVEQQIYPLSQEEAISCFKYEPPLGLVGSDDDIDGEELGLRRHRYVTRLLLSAYALDFVSSMLKNPRCTAEERSYFRKLRSRYISEVGALVKRLPILSYLIAEFGPVVTEFFSDEPNGKEITAAKIANQRTQNSSQASSRTPDMIWSSLLVLAGCQLLTKSSAFT